MDNPKYLLFTGSDDQYYFKLTAPNGQTILVSEGYTNKKNCEKGISSVRTNAPEDAHYKRLDSAGGQYYFNLVASNGQVIGKSEMYQTKKSRENGIAAVKINAIHAPTEDTTD